MKIPEVFARLREEARRLRDRGTSSQALSQMLKPNLGPTPEPLRRLLEPVVAATALAALLSLFALGAFSFATLVAIAGLAYAILTYVFGLELGLAT
jgi:hypothetical protein